jgi:phage FluMu protein Com
MVHYECGHSSPTTDFRRSQESVLVCPKCGKILKRVGIDYGMPGIGFKCGNCGEVCQFPLLLLSCRNAHESKIDQLELKSFPVYTLGRGISSVSNEIELLKGIQSELARIDIESEVFGSIIGESGIAHAVPLVIHGRRQQTAAVRHDKLITVSLIPKSAELEPFLLETLMRCVDLNAIALLVAIGKFDPKFEGLLNPRKIRLLEVRDEASVPQTVAREVREMFVKAD